MAVEAAKLQMRAASASLKAVEEGIALHAQNRDYGKLKEIAEASGLAAKVRNFPFACYCFRVWCSRFSALGLSGQSLKKNWSAQRDLLQSDRMYGTVLYV